VLEETAQWAHHYNLTTMGHQVIVMADHGSVSQAYPYRYANATLAVVFSGNHQKADDVLAHHVGFGLQESTTTTIMVVTAETELKSRCQRTVSKTSALHSNQRGIYFLDPTTFLNDHNNNYSQLLLSLEDQQQLEELEEECQWRALVLDISTKVQLDHHRAGQRGKLKKKGTMTNKRRQKLLSKLDTLQTKSAQRGPSLLHLVTSMDDDDEMTMTTMTARTRHSHQELIMKR
jgi:hypothetical protein